MTAYLRRHGFFAEREQIRICTAGEGATEKLVQDACKSVFIRLTSSSHGSSSSFDYYPKQTGSNYYSNNNTTGYGVLELDSVFSIRLDITYKEDGARADGPFSVQFSDLTYEFSSK